MRLRNYMHAAFPTPPACCDYSAKAINVLRDVYSNDSLGDCVIAGGYHITGVETGNAGATPFHATGQQIIDDYSKIGGYDPSNPSTDQGCLVTDALNYWSQHGFANGSKLLGWLGIDATNKSEVQTAMWLFENLIFGIELPDAWVNPFPSGDGFVWNVGKPNFNQGHCVVGVGHDSTGIQIATWGLIGTLTYEAIAALCIDSAGGEIYVALSQDQYAAGIAKAGNGLAWDALINDFNALGGHVAPPAPPPAPVPHGPTLAQAQAWAAQGLAAHWPK